MKWLILCCLFTTAFGAYCGTCAVNDDCNDESVCCNGTCVGPLPLGSACGVNICGSCGDYCVNGKCTEYDLGCSCTNDTGCGSDPDRSFCLAGSCVAAYETMIDQPCQDSRQCERGLYCIGSICQGNQTLNQSCEVDQSGRSNCAAAYLCDVSLIEPVCIERIPNGQACTTDTQCVAGSWCKLNESSFVCAPLTLIGGNCTASYECASQTCRQSTQLCVAAGTLQVGEICSSASACQSGACEFGPRNGSADTNQYCWAPTRTLANGEFCYPYADNCNGTCYCNSSCTSINMVAQCITPKSIPDGASCLSSLQCQNVCKRGLCISLQSINDGDECKLDDQCKGGSRCVTGLCTAAAIGSLCMEDDDCSLNQECICNGTRGTCQATASSILNYMYNLEVTKNCGDAQDEIAGYIGYCLSFPDELSSPLICQTLYAKSVCCQGCLLVNASLTYPNLSSVFSDISGSDVPKFSVDCSAYTLTSAKNECCGVSNSTCGFRKQVDLTKNCPGVATSSSMRSSSTSANVTMTETAVGSDADAMRIGWVAAVAILFWA